MVNISHCGLTSLLDVSEILVNCVVLDCITRLKTSGTYINKEIASALSRNKKYMVRLQLQKIKHNTFCLLSAVFLCSEEGLLTSENNKSPRSSKCLLISPGGILDECFCLTQITSWPPTAMPTTMWVPYVWMNLPNKLNQHHILNNPKLHIIQTVNFRYYTKHPNMNTNLHLIKYVLSRRQSVHKVIWALCWS
jgi:hypothetical protein